MGSASGAWPELRDSSAERAGRRRPWRTPVRRSLTVFGPGDESGRVRVDDVAFAIVAQLEGSAVGPEVFVSLDLARGIDYLADHYDALPANGPGRRHTQHEPETVAPFHVFATLIVRRIRWLVDPDVDVVDHHDALGVGRRRCAGICSRPSTRPASASVAV